MDKKKNSKAGGKKPLGKKPLGKKGKKKAKKNEIPTEQMRDIQKKEEVTLKFDCA